MYKHDKRGSKPSKPTTPITYLIHKKGKTTYFFQKKHLLNAGNISRASKSKDLGRLSLRFYERLAQGLNMDLENLIHELKKIQNKFMKQ